MMKALVARRRGGPEELHVEEVPVPTPAAGEALVEVHAAAITFTEFDWDETWTDRSGHDRTPVVFSHEISGLVSIPAADGTGPLAGEAVFGLVRFDHNGGAAEYVAMPAGELGGKPKTVNHVEAASLSLAALTAWQALEVHADVQPGHTVLVRGAAGGVGVYAVQIAADREAHVIAQCRPEHFDLVQDLGAEHLLDASDGEALGRLRGQVDVVIDAAGGVTPPDVMAAIVRGGRLVTLSSPAAPGVAERFGILPIFFIVEPVREHLDEIAAVVDNGRLRPIVAGTYPLADGRAAYESGLGRHGPGKTVLVVR